MPSANTTARKTVHILIANGFDEETTVYCLSQMRAAGLAVSLIGLSSGLLTSIYGLTVRPDLSLDQLPAHTVPHLVVAPGGAQSVSTLLTDPRFHALLEKTLLNGGLAAVTASAQPALVDSGVVTTAVASQFKLQNDLSLSSFVAQLVNYLLA